MTGELDVLIIGRMIFNLWLDTSGSEDSSQLVALTLNELQSLGIVIIMCVRKYFLYVMYTYFFKNMCLIVFTPTCFFLSIICIVTTTSITNSMVYEIGRLRGDCKPYPHNVNFRNIFLRN